MMNKQSLVAVAAIISTIGAIYFYNSMRNTSDSSEYELLAVADHEKLASGQFYNQMAMNESIENSIFNSDNHINVTTNSSSRSILVPAINAVAIAKFLNGNLPSTTPAGSISAPTLLSQTGAFSNLNTLEPSAGLIPYDMIEPFWSDGATKKRWMVIPNDGTHDTPEEQIQFSQDNAWSFPRGAVLIKHFEFPGKRLETRFEVKGDDDVYYYLTYKWNAAQTDATLLNNSVDEDIVVNGVTQSWHYPSRNECASCHFEQNGSVLGPKTRNLNKSILYPSSGVEMNQLVNLSELGILTENITNSNASSYPAVAAKNDLSASLEDRARSYIDVNCASCHNPQVDNIAMFDARYSTPLANQNIIYGAVVYDEGLNNPKVIIPQDVPNSMAHFRMNSTQTGIEMPPLAKDVVDTQGVQLIADWINSLTPTTSSTPEAAFSASTTYGPAPLNVDFDASASTDADGDTLTYSWDFADGSSGQGVNVNHIFTTAGSYTTTLTVSDGLQSDQETTTIIVNNSNPGSNTVAFTDGTSLIAQDNFSGLAMGVIDMNGDGKDDIVQFNTARNLRIQYQNAPGQTFSSYNYGQVSNKNQWSTAIADFDQNGYNDILSGGAYDNLKIITNNNGNNSYSLATLPNSNIFIQGSNFADINNDGWADIFACHDDAESRAYQNNQDGTFVFNADLISTETDPTSDNSGNYASMWIDYDNDRDLDLYISKCRGGVTSSSDPRRINMLWQNDGNNNFTEVAGQANLKIGDQTWLTDFGDIDNDGDLDAIVINHGTGPNLMRNNGNGTFTEITSGSGLLPTLAPQDFYGIQGFFRDFNNDGHLDLMVSGDNHYIFYNNGDGTFQNATNPFNSNQIQSFSVGDLNHDGFLDLYAGYATGLNSPSSTKDRIWLNEGNSNNFLNIQLKGTQSNINGIGARVELYGAWGMQIRDVRSGEGYGLVNSYTQHFGIGVNTQVEKVIVRWPSGHVDEILNPSPNQFLVITENSTIQVTNVSLSPNTATITEGATQQLTETITPTNADDTSVSWSSSDTTIATVDTNGLVTAVTEGTATITVTTTDGNFEATSLITVERAVIRVTGVNVLPDTATIVEGNTQQLSATVSPSNADDTSVSWSSSDTTVATVDTDGLVTAVAEGTATITVTTTDGSVEANSIITVESAPIAVTGVSVLPDTATLIEGTTQQLLATVSPSDADDTSVSWSSSDTTIATVDTNGLVTAVTEGAATITVTTTDGSFEVTSIITVERAAINVTGVSVIPGTATIVEGNTQQLSATVSPSNADNQGVNWSSNNTSIATVNQNGLVTAVSQGSATITVTTIDGNFSATSGITVEATSIPVTGINVNPSSAIVVEGATELLTATVQPANADDLSVIWLSSNATIATVNTNGLVTAITEGSATITAITINGNFSASSVITVEPASVPVTGINVTPSSAVVVEGATELLTATVQPANADDPSVIWFSNNTTIATVDTNGLVTAITEGSVTITATANDGGFSASTLITVQQNNTQDCTATGAITMRRYDNISGISLDNLFNAINFPDTPSITFELDSFEIPPYVANNYGAWVSGFICAPETGTYYFWISGDDYVRLSLSTDADPTNKTTIAYHNGHTNLRMWDRYDSQKSIGIPLEQGQTYYIESFVKEGVGGDHLSVGWRKPSGGPGDEPSEIIPGSVLSPNEMPNQVAVTGVSVDRQNVSLLEGNSTTIIAQVNPSNAENQAVAWSSNNTAIATVDQNGLVTAIAAGSATITVTTRDGGFTASSLISVEATAISVTGININPDAATLVEGTTELISATVLPADAGNQGVLWSSNNTAIATVDQNGLVTAIAPGSASITATTNDGGFTAAALISVEAAAISVSGININPGAATLVEGTTELLYATVLPVNADNQGVLWSSNNTAIATVDQNGLVTAIAPGSASITATTNDGGFTAAALISVEAAVISVSGININPDAATLIEGTTQLLSATVLPVNADNQGVLWSSNNTAMATVDQNGLVTAIAAGSASITATTNDGGFTAAALITVEASSISVTGINISPTLVNIVVDDTQLVTATITPFNADNQTVSWSSNDSSIATVDVNGLITAVAAGTTIVSVNTNDGNFTSNATVVVDEVSCPDTDGDGVCDSEDICPGGDDTIDTNGNGTPDACEACPIIDFNDYTLISYANQDNGPASIQDNGSTLYMTGNAWKAMEINYTITTNTILKFDFKSTAEGEIHEIGFDTDNVLAPNIRIVPFGNQGYNGNVASTRYSGDQNWQSYTINIGQEATGTFKYLVLTADDDVDGSGNSFFRNLSIFEDTNRNGIDDSCETGPCSDTDNDGICDSNDICEGGDDTIDSDGDGIPDFCDPGTSCTDVTVSIVFDDYAREVSWQLNDANGLPVLSGGGYTDADDFTTINESVCLPSGCYDFVIYDTYGDGICCRYGEGSYTVTSGSGSVLASGGNYTRSETTNFCVTDSGSSSGFQAVLPPSSSLALSPVPADNILNMEYFFAQGINGWTELSIFDTTGRLMVHKSISKDHFDRQINVSNFPDGAYMLKLTQGAETMTKQFVVKH